MKDIVMEWIESEEKKLKDVVHEHGKVTDYVMGKTDILEQLKHAVINDFNKTV